MNKQILSSIDALKTMNPYEGNNTLRAAALELFKFYSSLSEGEFDEMVDIIKKKPNFTKDDIKRMEEINQSIVSRENVLDKNLADAQTSFADKYKFPINRNKLQNEIDNMNK